MAVIREQRTFRNQPIGVVRASRAGEEYWQTVGRAADELTQTAYRAAADQAKRTGTETAEAIKGSDFRTIDPLTGEIETFNMPSVPKGFGTIARDAFEKVAENRYVTSVESAIKEKSAEIALRHQNHPQAVERYEADMGEYLSQVTKNVQPRFQETARDIAAAWMASTRANLLAKRFAIQSEVEQLNLSDDANSDANQTQKMFAMGAYEDGNVLIQSRIEKINNAVSAGVLTASQANNQIKRIRSSAFEGRASHIISNFVENDNITSADINKLQIIVQQSGRNVKDIDQLPENVQGLVKSLLNENDFPDFKDQVLRDLTNFQARVSNKETAERIARNEEERAKAKADKLESEANQAGVSNLINTQNSEISNSILSGNFAKAKSSYKTLEKELRSKLGKGIGLDFIERRLFESRKDMFSLLTSDANDLASTKQMQDFAKYLSERGTADVDLPTELKSIADNILQITTTPSDYASVNSLTDSYVNKKIAVDKANATVSADQKATNEIVGGVGTSTNTRHTRVVHNALGNQFNFDPSVVNWYTTDEGYSQLSSWSQIAISSNVIPEPLIAATKGLASGRALPQESNRLLDIYARFRDVRTIEGEDPINMWEGVLDLKEQSLLEATIYASALLPEGQANIPEIINEIRQFRNDTTQMKLRVQAVLGDDETIEGFTERLLTDDPFIGADVKNPNVMREMMPVVEYLVAGNAKKSDIESTFKRIYEQHYPETDGIVIDPAFGPNIHRSAQSLRAAFPNSSVRSQAVSILNDELADVGLGDYVFQTEYKSDIATDIVSGRLPFGGAASVLEDIGVDQMPVKAKGRKKAYLIPRLISGTAIEDVRYMVVTQNERGLFEPLIGREKVETAEGDTPAEMQTMPTLVEFSLDQLRAKVRESLQ